MNTHGLTIFHFHVHSQQRTNYIACETGHVANVKALCQSWLDMKIQVNCGAHLPSQPWLHPSSISYMDIVASHPL